MGGASEATWTPSVALLNTKVPLSASTKSTPVMPAPAAKLALLKSGREFVPATPAPAAQEVTNLLRAVSRSAMRNSASKGFPESVTAWVSASTRIFWKTASSSSMFATR